MSTTCTDLPAAVIEVNDFGNPPRVTTPPNEPTESLAADPATGSSPDIVESLTDTIRPAGPRPLAQALKSVENLSAVDAPASKLADLLRNKIPPTALALLRGQWLGHPLHPVLVTVPIGAWMAVPVLDVTGESIAAKRLVAFGIAAAVPATVTGFVEYTTLDTAQRRVAVVHMAANTVSLACFARSWWQRRTGSAIRGSGWSLTGLAVTGVSGALGGHLSYSQSAGVLRER
jgi:uncharacterized membrane protein